MQSITKPSSLRWEVYRQDLVKAKDLLAQSTAAGGADVELIYDSGSDIDTLIVQILQCDNAVDITAHGGWRGYTDRTTQPASDRSEPYGSP